MGGLIGLLAGSTSSGAWAAEPSTDEISAADGEPQAIGAFPALLPVQEASGGVPDTKWGTLAGPATKSVAALMVVLSIFGGVVWFGRRYGSDDSSPEKLPADVFRNLGQAAIDARTRVVFLKVGPRVLLVATSEGDTPRTLAEISDPAEVQRIANRCAGRPEIVGRRDRVTVPREMEITAADLAVG